MMVGDFDKYNLALENLRLYEAQRACHGRRFLPAKWLWRLIASVQKPDNLNRKEKAARSTDPATITWHHLSTRDACSMLEAAGYHVLDSDMKVNHRDPVIHFVRP